MNYSQIVDLNPSLDYELLQRAQALERFLDRRSCTNSGLAVARATISCCNHFLLQPFLAATISCVQLINFPLCTVLFPCAQFFWIHLLGALKRILLIILLKETKISLFFLYREKKSSFLKEKLLTTKEKREKKTSSYYSKFQSLASPHTFSIVPPK